MLIPNPSGVHFSIVTNCVYFTFLCRFFFFLLLFFILFPPFLVYPSHSHLVMIIRLQVPRLALRRRLNTLSGSVSRPAPWRRRPIAFLCYVLSASALRPLANRVRAAVSWLDSGKESGAVNANDLDTFITVSASFRFTALLNRAILLFTFWLCVTLPARPFCTGFSFYLKVLGMLQEFSGF